jgi:type I restriction enzyme S subunit
MKRWPTKPLREFCEFRHGNTPSKAQPTNWNGSFPWVSPKDMKVEVILDTEDHLSQEAIAADRAAIAKKTSLLVVVRSGILAHTFPVAIAGRDVAFNQDLKSLRVVVSTVAPHYLFRFLQASSRQILAQGTKRGPTVHSLRSGFLESLHMPVPPLAEQERIVKLLDEADDLRKLRAQADRRTANLIPALFHEMFGDPISNPNEWPVKLADEFIKTCEYGTSQKANEAGRGIPVLRMNNVRSDGQLDLAEIKTVELGANELSKQRLQIGDVLFNRTNSRELVGKTGMWDGRFEAVAASYFIRIRVCDDIEDPLHFTTFMNMPFMKRRLAEMARGAVGQANINAKELRSIRVPVPPLRLQKEFARLVTEIRGMEAEQVSSSRRLEDLFQSLLQRAFRGEL